MMIGVTYIFPEVFCPPCNLLTKKVMIKVEMKKKRKETEVSFNFYLQPIEPLSQPSQPPTLLVVLMQPISNLVTFLGKYFKACLSQDFGFLKGETMKK